MALRSAVLSTATAALKIKAAYCLFLPNRVDDVVDRGFTVCLHYYDPSLLKSISRPPQKSDYDPLRPPFSPGIHITDLGSGASHHLLVNMFMHKLGHVVLSSTDPRESQDDPLHSRDFAALSQILTAFSGDGIGYYNCGIDSGCTQLHKHLQYVPLTQIPLFRAMSRQEALPWVYRSIPLPDLSPLSIGAAYEELMDKARRSVAISAYNFVVGAGHALLVPRRMARNEWKIVVNSIGISGHLPIWESSAEMVKKAPISIIRGLCYPADGA
jgi:ATP adenylyltransferase/5',5'''-P-1,P-4-tetraphosphate phosphorylase II